MKTHLQKIVFLCISAFLGFQPVHASIAFESGQVRPLALSDDGSRLFAVNTPDNTLEIFHVGADGLSKTASVPVGLEPVAVAVAGNGEVWVVNHLSDSVSVVDASATPPRLVRTLLVGDEPRDIVFAGPGANRAFITTAHRGQNSPWCGNSNNPECLDPNNPAEAKTPGAGRADVWVFDASAPGNGLGGQPITIITLFTDTPRALATSPDGSQVYAAGFHTGNQTTVINEGAVCNGGTTANPCNPGSGPEAPGGLPAPNANIEGTVQPEVGLIVKYDGTDWVDELGRSWNNQVMFDLPDEDVFTIDANANPPTTIDNVSGVGTIIYNMASNPVSGKIYITNTDARNEVRFEGARAEGSLTSSVIGHLHEAHITVIDGQTVETRHLNKHIDYSQIPSPAGTKEKSLATPMGMAISSDGNTLYVAAFGSSKVGIFDTRELEDNTFTPNSNDHITLSGGGPSGIVLDEIHGKLYALTRFDNSISVVDTASRSEVDHIALHNPEPEVVVKGRPFLYSATLTSSNGEASCSSCHVFGDTDSLAWDLGDPEGIELPDPNPSGPLATGNTPFHPMKGPMTTQSLRGLANHGPMHWRGDRTAGHSGGDPLDEIGAFEEFNVAFVGLLGRDSELSTQEMRDFAEFAMTLMYPPNPIRQLDNTLTPDQSDGSDLFFNVATTAGLTCNACHVIDESTGFFGTNGLMSFEGETQNFKIPHLRNLYQKVGMFGMEISQSIISGDSVHMGDQIRGFGYLHDGSVDTLFRFHGSQLFSLSDDQQRDVEQFMLASPSNLKPIVGQQITVDASNSTVANQRKDLLLQQAAAGHSDIIVKGIHNGEQRGWVRVASGADAGKFRSDKTGDSLYTGSQLQTIATTAGQSLTYTSVPAGTGHRIGIDRDQDTVLDGDDLCPALADTDQTDTDNDGRGDVCDNCPYHANTNQWDSNGDGFGNRCDADLNNDNFVNIVDFSIFKSRYGTNDPDADFDGSGFVNIIDFSIFKSLYGNAPGAPALSSNSVK